MKSKATHPFWAPFWGVVEHVSSNVVVILVCAVQCGVPQVCHHQEMHSGGCPHWWACQETVHRAHAQTLQCTALSSDESIAASVQPLVCLKRVAVNSDISVAA